MSICHLYIRLEDVGNLFCGLLGRRPGGTLIIFPVSVYDSHYQQSRRFILVNFCSKFREYGIQFHTLLFSMSSDSLST